MMNGRCRTIVVPASNGLEANTPWPLPFIGATRSEDGVVGLGFFIRRLWDGSVFDRLLCNDVGISTAMESTGPSERDVIKAEDDI